MHFNVLMSYKLTFIYWELRNWNQGGRIELNFLEAEKLHYRSTGSVRSGRPDLARKRKKIRAVQKCKVAFWPPPVPFSAPLPLGTSQHILVSHTTQFEAILERETSERRWNKLISSWGNYSWPREFHFGPSFSTIFRVSF